MPVQRFIDFELRSPEVCNFLTSNPEVPTFEAEIEIPSGYSFSNHSKVLTPNEEDSRVDLFTSVIKEYLVWESKSKSIQPPITIHKTVTRLGHPLKLEFLAYLCIKDEVSDTQRKAITAVFDSFQPSSDDLDSIETQLVNSGISLNLYSVLLTFRLTRSGPVFVADRWHDDYLKNNESLELIEVNKKVTCELPTLNFDDPTRTAEVDDFAHADWAIDRLSTDVSAILDCDRMRSDAKEKIAAFSYKEFKVEMRIKRIRIGRCRIAKTRIPVLLSRTTRVDFYAIVISPTEAIPQLMPLFLHCLREVVGSARIDLLLMWDFPSAVAAFKAGVTSCLRNRVLPEIARCLAPELLVVKSKSNWV